MKPESSSSDLHASAPSSGGVAGNLGMSTKTLEESFVDWESNAFGYGYGTGEEHTVPALHRFLAAFHPHPERHYDYKELEAAMGPAVAWLLINALCHADIIEYGTSPRYGWLTPQGEELRRFVLSKTPEELVEVAAGYPDDYTHCYPDACNCGPNGYQEGRVCVNPFWGKR